MKRVIFLPVIACLLAGCASKESTEIKIKTEAEVKSEQGLSVKVAPQDEKPLPVKIVQDEIILGAFVASLIAVIATSLAAVAAWRAAYNAKKALEKNNKIGDE